MLRDNNCQLSILHLVKVKNKRYFQTLTSKATEGAYSARILNTEGWIRQQDKAVTKVNIVINFKH